jgi:hypothetical protein
MGCWNDSCLVQILCAWRLQLMQITNSSLVALGAQHSWSA